MVDFPVTLSQSLREGGAWWHAGGSETTVDFFDSTKHFTVYKKAGLHIKILKHIHEHCAFMVLPQTTVMHFVLVFWLVLKNVAEMHNLSSTACRDVNMYTALQCVA